MRKGHLILILSVLWGSVLQLFLAFLPFEWATFSFILLNLSVPYLVILYFNPQCKRWIPWGKIRLTEVLILWVLALLSYMGLQIIVKWTSIFIDNPIPYQKMEPSWPLFIGFVVVAPIIEELFFRGYLLTVYQRLNIKGAALWVSLWFALYHMNLHQGIYTFVFALVLSLVMYWRHNVVLAILLHSAVNGLSYVLLRSDSAISMPKMINSGSWSFGMQLLFLTVLLYIGLKCYAYFGPSRTHDRGKRLSFDASLIALICIFVWTLFSKS